MLSKWLQDFSVHKPFHLDFQYSNNKPARSIPPWTCSISLISVAKLGWAYLYLDEWKYIPFPLGRNGLCLPDGLLLIPAISRDISGAFSAESLLVSVLWTLSTDFLGANIKHTQSLRQYGNGQTRSYSTHLLDHLLLVSFPNIYLNIYIYKNILNIYLFNI